MDIRFTERPEMFGTLHLAYIALTILFGSIAIYHISNKSEKYLLKLLQCIGFFMIISEIIKQFFCHFYIYGKEPDLTYFPWQLCSMAMYFAFMVPFLKGKVQDATLVYLSTFSLLGGVMAIILPKNMLLSEVFFTTHSFLYHAFIIITSFIAIEILKRRNLKVFRHALILFGITAVIAEIINVLGKVFIGDPTREPNMFYISPFYPTKQAILSDIARKFGIIPEVIIYLLIIVLIAYMIFVIESKTIWIKRDPIPSSLVQSRTYVINLQRGRSIIAFIACTIVFIFCSYAVVGGLIDDPTDLQPERRGALFHLFTVNANVFSALGAIMMIPYAVEGIRKKHFTYPKWIQIIQYSGAICTTLTMLFVIFLIFPVAGPFVAFGGIYVWLHLVCPIMSLILLFSVDSSIEITKKDAFIGICPFCLYALNYFIHVVVVGEAHGGWRDIYRLVAYVPPFVSAPIMLAFALGVAFAIRFFYNRLSRKRQKALRQMWDDSLSPVDIRIEMYGLGHFNGKNCDINNVTIPFDIIHDLSNKYSIEMSDLLKAYNKGLIDGLEEKKS